MVSGHRTGHLPRRSPSMNGIVVATAMPAVAASISLGLVMSSIPVKRRPQALLIHTAAMALLYLGGAAVLTAVYTPEAKGLPLEAVPAIGIGIVYLMAMLWFLMPPLKVRIEPKKEG